MSFTGTPPLPVEQTSQLLFTIDDVAQALRCSRIYVERAISRGELESVRMGRLRRVSRAQLERFVANLEAQSSHVA